MKKAAAFVTTGVLLVLAWMWYCGHSVLAEPSEQAIRLPGDELIPAAIGSVTHAITIERSPRDVWPWLAQMGSGRAGWYAYDFIDNGEHPSAQSILPEYQNVVVGTVFPALPGAKDVFLVARCEAPNALVLTWRSSGGAYLATWSFVLEEPQPGRTRLIVRGRAGPDYHPYGLPLWVARSLAPLVHGVMQRKQLLGIKGRAQATRH